MSLESMKARITYNGGAAQQDRMIKDKAKSLLSAIQFSYQAARFKKYPQFDCEIRGLFNPVNQTENYDTKMISVPNEAQFKVGEIFSWENTDTKWICFMEDKTELAYFRGECRRCDHKIKWIDKDRQECETLVSVIGPSAPSLRTSSSMQAKVAQDFPNANLVMLVQDNERNAGFFHRYQVFLIKGIAYHIEHIDNLSMPGIIQVMAIEHYVNKIEHDIENSVTNVWNVQPILEDEPTGYMIEGPLTTKPMFKTEYSVPLTGGQWMILENVSAPKDKLLPAKFVESDHTLKTITVYWDAITSGSFTLAYKTAQGQIYQRHILVESLM